MKSEPCRVEYRSFFLPSTHRLSAQNEKKAIVKLRSVSCAVSGEKQYRCSDDIITL